MVGAGGPASLGRIQLSERKVEESGGIFEVEQLMTWIVRLNIADSRR